MFVERATELDVPLRLLEIVLELPHPYWIIAMHILVQFISHEEIHTRRAAYDDHWFISQHNIPSPLAIGCNVEVITTSRHSKPARQEGTHSRTNLRWRKRSFTIEARFAFYREVAPGTFARGCGAGATAHSRKRGSHTAGQTCGDANGALR